jgi:type VI secretion system secreted protein Hcp
MAQEIYLYLDGIPGESNKSGAEGWIEIFSFSNGLTNHSSVAAGTGSGSGKVEFSSISVTKQLDKSSMKLALNNMKGTHIAKGNIIVRQSGGGDTTQTYFQYDLQEVFVDSMSWGAAAGGGGKPSESVSFSFNQIQISYWQQKPDGSQELVAKVGWNTQTNKSV